MKRVLSLFVMSYIHEHPSTYPLHTRMRGHLYPHADGLLRGWTSDRLRGRHDAGACTSQDSKAKLCILVEDGFKLEPEIGDKMNGYGLYWGDYLAIAILVGVLSILLGAMVWDMYDKIADRRSADKHWETTIREER